MPAASSPVPASSTSMCISASPARRTRRRSRPDRGPPRPADSPPSSACRTPRRWPTAPGTIEYIHNAIEHGAVVHVYPTGCITVGQKGEQLAPTGSLKRAGVVAITDDGRCVQNNEIMRRAVEYAKMFDLPIMDHCQDEP